MAGWGTWTSKNPTWGALTPYQKAAAMSLLEADGANPDHARNALGAMINRAAKYGQDLGYHVSQRIYQPTIEPAQEARLGRILQNPAFPQLTSWAERRAQGLEADPVNGATHFLAKPEVMLALERRDPGKYKNWGPRGANWTGYDPTTGQYKNQTHVDGSHAFLAPEGTYSVPTGDPTAQDNVGFGYRQTPSVTASPSASPGTAVAGYEKRDGGAPRMADDKEMGFFDKLGANVAYNPLVSGGIGLFLSALQGGNLNEGLSAGTQRASANTRDAMLKRDAAIKAFRERQWENTYGPNSAGVPDYLKDTPWLKGAIYAAGPERGMEMVGGLLQKKALMEMQDAERVKIGQRAQEAMGEGVPEGVRVAGGPAQAAPAVPAPVERGPIPPANLPPQAAAMPPQLGGDQSAAPPQVDPAAAARTLVERQNGGAVPMPQPVPQAAPTPAPGAPQATGSLPPVYTPQAPGRSVQPTEVGQRWTPAQETAWLRKYGYMMSDPQAGPALKAFYDRKRPYSPEEARDDEIKRLTIEEHRQKINQAERQAQIVDDFMRGTPATGQAAAAVATPPVQAAVGDGAPAPAGAAASSPGAGAMPPGTQPHGMAQGNVTANMVPLSANAERAIRMITLGGLKGDRAMVTAGTNILNADPTYEARKAQSTKMGSQAAEMAERQRAGQGVMSTFDHFKEAVKAMQEKEPEAFNNAIGRINNNDWFQTVRSSTLGFLPNTYTRAADMHVRMNHLVDGLTTAFMTGAARTGMQMSDARMQKFTETMGEFRRASTPEQFNAILGDAEKIIKDIYSLSDAKQGGGWSIKRVD